MTCVISWQVFYLEILIETQNLSFKPLKQFIATLEDQRK